MQNYATLQRLFTSWHGTMIPLRMLLALQSIAVGVGHLWTDGARLNFYKTLSEAEWGPGFLFMTTMLGMALVLVTLVEGRIRFIISQHGFPNREKYELCLTGQTACKCNSMWVAMARRRSWSYFALIATWSGLTYHLWLDSVGSLMDSLAPLQVLFLVVVAVNDALQVRKVLHRDQGHHHAVLT